MSAPPDALSLPGLGAPLPPPDEADSVHVHSEVRGSLGAMSRRALFARVAAGEVGGADLFWYPGLDTWYPVGEHPALFADLRQVTALDVDTERVPAPALVAATVPTATPPAGDGPDPQNVTIDPVGDGPGDSIAALPEEPAPAPPAEAPAEAPVAAPAAAPAATPAPAPAAPSAPGLAALLEATAAAYAPWARRAAADAALVDALAAAGAALGYAPAPGGPGLLTLRRADGASLRLELADLPPISGAPSLRALTVERSAAPGGPRRALRLLVDADGAIVGAPDAAAALAAVDAGLHGA